MNIYIYIYYAVYSILYYIDGMYHVSFVIWIGYKMDHLEFRINPRFEALCSVDSSYKPS